ncbi:MAG: DUF4157 domain-containing protein [Dechloromonas sp.]|nr:DUF4157 domain-containing protein [Dechloromonas sp.]
MSQLARPIPAPIAAPVAVADRPAKVALTATHAGLQAGKASLNGPPVLAPVLAAGGQPLPDALRREFEPFFGHDLSRVRIHANAPAHQAATHLAADAFAIGRDIGFAAERYRPDTVGGRRLLVHELAHVVQQGSAQTTDVQPARLPGPAEREADAAALAFLSARPGPPLSRFRPGLACAVKTNGGEFKTDTYIATNVPPKGGGKIGKRVGADIKLRFKPNELVEADLIGTVQTVRTLKATKAGGPIDTLNSPTAHMGSRALVKGESDPGRFIDQTDLGGTGKKQAPNTSPLYATNAQQGATPKTLTEGVPAPETVGATAGYGKDDFGEHGYRKKKPDGSFETKDATLSDRPGSTITFNKQEFEMKFEVAALALSGPMANTYLGSVEWGWKCDATGTSKTEPPALRLISPGLPTSAFVDAAKKWNAAKTVKDPKSKKKLDTIDLPLPTAATETSNKPAAERGTGELLVALGSVDTALGTAKDVDKTAKTLEKRAMEQALAGRQALVDVNVRKTEDWTGADEVYAVLISGSKRQKTPVKSLNDGQSGSFALPLRGLMPITGPIAVRIYDEDTGTFFDEDDIIVNMAWQPPYGAIRNTRSLDEADYDVRVRFNK